MKSCWCSFLSRLALPGLATLMALVLWSPALARADTISTFDVSCSALNNSGGSLDSCASLATYAFSGTFQVDVTIGIVESGALDITFPGWPAFDNLLLEGPIAASGWSIGVLNNSSDELILNFTTAPTPGSLVGFTSGTIFGNTVLSSGKFLHTDFSGSITNPLPESSSLAPWAGGLVWLVFGLARRRRRASNG